MYTKSSASLLAVLAAVSMIAASAGAAPGGHDPFNETLLSNEMDTSRWAFVSADRVTAWSQPRDRGRKLITLTRTTPDKTSELVLTLRERVYEDGTVWTEVRLPTRGSDARGWVDREKLDKYRVIHTRIEVDRAAKTAKLFKNEALVWQADVTVGDKRHTTPGGSFYVRDRLETSDAKGKFGPFALGLSAQARRKSDWPGKSTVGIHGTNRAKRIPGTAPDACVRVTNKKIRELFKLTPPGTPVKIL